MDLSAEGLRGIVMAGLGGGLDPTLKVGDVVVDALSDESMGQRLPYRRGGMHTAKQIVSTPAERAAVFQATGALAVEMENEVVRAVAAQLGVAYVGIRAISDCATETLNPSLLRWVDDLGRVKVKALVGTLVRRPGLVGELNRLRKQSALAVANLAEAVRQVARLAK